MENKTEKVIVLILGIIGLLFFIPATFAIIGDLMLTGNVPGFYGLIVVFIPFLFVIIAIAGVWKWMQNA